MRIYIEQVPENVSWDEYPPNTEFIMDDARPKRDPVTLRLIIPDKRPSITPEQAWEDYKKTNKS